MIRKYLTTGAIVSTVIIFLGGISTVIYFYMKNNNHQQLPIPQNFTLGGTNGKLTIEKICPEKSFIEVSDIVSGIYIDSIGTACSENQENSIISITSRYGVWLDNITIKTKNGNANSNGGKGGNITKEIKCQNDVPISGISFTYGKFIDSITIVCF